MRNYFFPCGENSVIVKSEIDPNKSFEITFAKNSVVYLNIKTADGICKERLSVEEVIDNMPDATAEDLKAFCGFIFLLGRRM